FAALVDEVHAEAVHVGAKVWKAIERLLLLPPVKSRQPMSGQLSQVRATHPGSPTVVLDAIRPASAHEPVLQIVEHVLGHVDLIWPDAHQCTSSQRVCDVDARPVPDTAYGLDVSPRRSVDLAAPCD